LIFGVVTTSYPRTPGDLAGCFVADRVQELVAAGHRVEVIAGGGPGASSDGAVSLIRLPSSFGGGPDLFGGGGAPEALEEGRGVTLLAAGRFAAGLAAAVAARAPRWDRVESHWLAPSALAVLAAAPRLPHRAYAHSGDVALLERMPLGRALAARLAGSGAELVFVSEALRSRFARLCGVAVGTVEPLRPPAALFPRRAPGAGRPAGGARVAISVGRLVPIKGHDLLVRACALQRAGERVDAVVLGDGPERDRLRALADRLGVSLSLPGRVPRHEVAAHLRAADVYVQPSRVLANGRTEGLPLATLEALAVGLPVIAGRSGGLAELDGLPNLGGRVTTFEAGDAFALAGALRRECVGAVTAA
jgi:hypothetical protein